MTWWRRRLTWRSFSAARAVFWLVSIPPAYWLGWLRSVTYVSLLSVAALVESALAAWRADVPTDRDHPR